MQVTFTGTVEEIRLEMQKFLQSSSDRSDRSEKDWLPKIVRFLEDGKIIDAIKLYKESTGRTLRDSKEAVERIGVNSGFRVNGVWLSSRF